MDKPKKKPGRNKNSYESVYRSVPVPALEDYAIWLANWKKENK